MPLTHYLRLKLLGRLAREIGALRLVLVLPLLGLALLQVLAVLGGHPVGRWALPGLLGLALLGVHRQRADAQFLATTLRRPAPYLAAEYALLSLPLAGGLLGMQAPGAALLSLCVAALVAWAPPARPGRATRHRWPSLFRAEAFEWVGGLRGPGGLLWPGLLALAAWPWAKPVGPVVALLGWLLVVLGCYGTPEPLTMLALALRQPGQFLRRRLALGLGYAALTAAPLLACLGSGRLALILGGYWLALLALCILAKYAFYPNAPHIRVTQGLVLALGLLALGHPAFPPLMLVAVSGLIWQSQRRLRSVLSSEPSPSGPAIASPTSAAADFLANPEPVAINSPN
ncbi:MAG: hypothetical protein ACRYFK_19130 [Janthinobacterium lividum]